MSRAEPGIDRTARATYQGRCALHPQHLIEPNDTIGLTFLGWLCAECTADAQT